MALKFLENANWEIGLPAAWHLETAKASAGHYRNDRFLCVSTGKGVDGLRERPEAQERAAEIAQ
jgi:hypothetical protein